MLARKKLKLAGGPARKIGFALAEMGREAAMATDEAALAGVRQAKLPDAA